MTGEELRALLKKGSFGTMNVELLMRLSHVEDGEGDLVSLVFHVALDPEHFDPENGVEPIAFRAVVNAAEIPPGAFDDNMQSLRTAIASMAADDILMAYAGDGPDECGEEGVGEPS